MDWINASYIATVIGTVFGGFSLIVSVLPFLRGKTKYETLMNSLEKIVEESTPSRAAKKTSIPHPKEDSINWKAVLKWLDYGEVILSSVREKVTRRSVVVAGIILTEIVSINSLSLINALGQSRNYILLLVLPLATSITPVLGFIRRFIIEPEERAFLNNLDAIYNIFYKIKVAAAINAFNCEFEREFRNTSSVKAYQTEIRVLRSEVKALVRIFNRLESKTAADSDGDDKQLIES